MNRSLLVTHQYKSEVFSIREMVTQINTIIHGQCEEKGLTYENSITGFAEEYYTGDSLRLRQVIINILANAVKFTDPPGLVRFTAQQICLEAGMNAHLSKPVDIDQLTKLLGRFLTERNR